MPALARNYSWHCKLPVAVGVSPANSTPSHTCKPITLATITGVFCPLLGAFAQDITPTPKPVGQRVATAVEVIVTGSNIPTAEEVGPQPVDTYRRDDITRLGVRSATDFIQKLPVATGPSINENINTLGNGQTEIDPRSPGRPGRSPLPGPPWPPRAAWTRHPRRAARSRRPAAVRPARWPDRPWRIAPRPRRSRA